MATELPDYRITALERKQITAELNRRLERLTIETAEWWQKASKEGPQDAVLLNENHRDKMDNIKKRIDQLNNLIKARMKVFDAELQKMGLVYLHNPQIDFHDLVCPRVWIPDMCEPEYIALHDNWRKELRATLDAAHQIRWELGSYIATELAVAQLFARDVRRLLTEFPTVETVIEQARERVAARGAADADA